jgi:hypothetical protein
MKGVRNILIASPTVNRSLAHKERIITLKWFSIDIFSAVKETRLAQKRVYWQALRNAVMTYLLPCKCEIS